MNAVVSVASVASAVYDQVSQLVPVQQVDDIDEVHQLDPVHQVDHKDACSKISLQKRHHKMDQPGFKKKLFPTFFKKSRGHFEGSDFKPFVILGRVPVDFKVVFGRFFLTSGNGPKLSKMDLGTVLAGFWGGRRPTFRGGVWGRSPPN